MSDPVAPAPCRNDAARKSAEVKEAVVELSDEGSQLRDQLNELHRRGAFRHEHDVAFSVIMIERGRSVDDLADYLPRDYALLDHRCDPVFPPS